MIFIQHYDSPLGGVLPAPDEIGTERVWFDGQKYLPAICLPSARSGKHPFLRKPSAGLTFIFRAKSRTFCRRCTLSARRSVGRCGAAFANSLRADCDLRRNRAAACRKEVLTRMSAQAVGGAVGHNEISIIIPCHRVVGTNGNLTGYAGGIDKR